MPLAPGGAACKEAAMQPHRPTRPPAQPPKPPHSPSTPAHLPRARVPLEDLYQRRAIRPLEIVLLRHRCSRGREGQVSVVHAEKRIVNTSKQQGQGGGAGQVEVPAWRSDISEAVGPALPWGQHCRGVSPRGVSDTGLACTPRSAARACWAELPSRLAARPGSAARHAASTTAVTHCRPWILRKPRPALKWRKENENPPSAAAASAAASPASRGRSRLKTCSSPSFWKSSMNLAAFSCGRVGGRQVRKGKRLLVPAGLRATSGAGPHVLRAGGGPQPAYTRARAGALGLTTAAHLARHRLQ